MSKKNPRLCVVLDEELYERIKLLAKIKNISVSSLVCELIREALDLEEDLLLSKYLKEREEKNEKDRKSKKESLAKEWAEKKDIV